MTGPERAELDRLKSQLAELAGKVGRLSGPGVSTGTAGALHVRSTQLGFAAELTGGWDASTGYPWKRLRLDGVTVGNPGVQPAGTGAVAVGGDTGLTGGTRGWLEPSPDGVGYLFTLGTQARGDITFNVWRYACVDGDLVETQYTVTVTGRNLSVAVT
jgi:hypothetical protein